MTFASVDWAMSLEPHWYSAAYGVIAVVGQGLAALAFTALLAARAKLQNDPPHEPAAHGAHEHAAAGHAANGHAGNGHDHGHHPTLLQDLGNLMLAFTMLFTYVSFSQFLIIWFGDLPEEVVWYLARFEHGWQVLAVGLVLFHFAVPFGALMPRGVKRNPRTLTAVACLILVVHWFDGVWKIGPAFHGSALQTIGAYIGPALLVAGVFWLLMSWSLPRQFGVVEIAFGRPARKEAH
ncbi:MAG: hypothetical protein QM775_08895 [Pirellulales bacterium]